MSAELDIWQPVIDRNDPFIRVSNMPKHLGTQEASRLAAQPEPQWVRLLITRLHRSEVERIGACVFIDTSSDLEAESLMPSGKCSSLI
jgi:hypothetical protein